MTERTTIKQMDTSHYEIERRNVAAGTDWTPMGVGGTRSEVEGNMETVAQFQEEGCEYRIVEVRTIQTRTARPHLSVRKQAAEDKRRLRGGSPELGYAEFWRYCNDKYGCEFSQADIGEVWEGKAVLFPMG